MPNLFAETALLPDGWVENVRIEVGYEGRIQSIEKNQKAKPDDLTFKDRALLPAPTNLHSHGFQRALAGLTETRGASGQDSFWTWRRIMYSFLEHLTPEDTEAINAFAQMEMLEAGYACVAEFHYVHHQANGTPYDNIAEKSHRVISASEASGIGLTLLPVYYAQGGVDGRQLEGGQLRFKNNIQQYEKLWDGASRKIQSAHIDNCMGIAPHSLRAVSKQDLEILSTIYADGPIHIHIAEQLAEIEEISRAYGKPPVQWLLDNFGVDKNWCLIHATHLTDAECMGIASSGAVAGLCPITEANLGDGIFDAKSLMKRNGVIGLGTDSNVSISLVHELRALEYSQRLNLKGRAILSTSEKSTGRTLFDAVCYGGAMAAGRKSGSIEVGAWADILALDTASIDLLTLKGDTLLDTWFFASNSQLVTDVWSAGRHVVQNSHHINRERIERDYKTTILKLRGLL
ncbi:formimidoylglutamate deiminase [Alphaproteobacteria bacterium 46_93_T64]|nr:formimidoylglutamate deiminase [Alphaproteobacteria bacterium 46_93_T64]